MDIELVGAIANGAKIVVYFAEPDEAGVGLVQAFHAAINDRQRRPSVISCSWGVYEECCGKPQVHSLERALEFASTVNGGITVTCASGDWGDGVDAEGHLRVMYPASSPFVLACGGTSLDFSQPAKETVWNEEPVPQVKLASGGGVSRLFGLPSWQDSVGVPSQAGRRGRGVPDVASRANLLQGLELCVGGQSAFVGGGTSAAAPVWAGLVARLNQGLKLRLGHLNPRLYEKEFADAFHDITEGGNGHFTARRGWDACTGLGRPIGDALFAALRGT
jgi:kumamolisin